MKRPPAGPTPAESTSIELLLDTAVAAFAEHGYEGVSMRALAERCGVTTATIYYHFESKDALYNEVCRRRFDDMSVAMQQALNAARSADARLDAFVGTLFDEWYRDKTLLLLTQRDVISALISPEHCLARRHYDQLMGLIAGILSPSPHQPVDADLVFSFGALLYGYCTLMNFEQQLSPLDRAAFLRHRRAVLLQHSRLVWKTLNETTRSAVAAEAAPADTRL